MTKKEFLNNYYEEFGINIYDHFQELSLFIYKGFRRDLYNKIQRYDQKLKDKKFVYNSQNNSRFTIISRCLDISSSPILDLYCTPISETHIILDREKLWWDCMYLFRKSLEDD